MLKLKPVIFAFSMLVVATVVLSACNMPGSSAPTVAPEVLYTAAAETVIAQLTQAAPTQPAMTLAATPTTQVAPVATATTAATAVPPTETQAPTAIPTATATATATPTSVVVVPCNRAQFVTDVTFPDWSVIPAGTTFVKTWRLKNNGTCTWNANYVLVFVGNNSLSGPAAVPITTGSVAPGATVDVSVTLKAPTTPGNYESDWMLGNGAGQVFGIGDDANHYFWARITVPGATTAVPTAVSGVTRLSMVSGGTSVSVAGTAPQNGRVSYVAYATTGQFAQVTISSSSSALALEVQAPTGVLLLSAASKVTNWKGTLPANGDYLISVVNSGAAANFTLNLTIPVRVNFALGTTGTSVIGTVAPQWSNAYVLRALKNQVMTVTINSDRGDVYLNITGWVDGVTYVSASSKLNTFTFTLPSDQDYMVQCVSYSNASENYTVSFTIK
jgi:hypothetical protein